MTATVADLSERRVAALDPALRERPSHVLPDPGDLRGVAVYDTETSGLFVDDGARVAAVGVAYRLRSDTNTIWHHAFPFDQGLPEEKGFTTQYYPELDPDRRYTPAQQKTEKYAYAGRPCGDPAGRWDWDTDFNLPEAEWTTFCEWLVETGKAVGHSNQNIKYDVNLMRAGTRKWRGVELEKYVRWDTMLANPILWPTAGTNALKPIGALLWGEDAVAEAGLVQEGLIEVRKRYGLAAGDKRYDLLPWEVNGPYASADTVLALRLTEFQEALIEEGYAPGTRIVKAVELARVLSRMERRGFGPYDVHTSAEIADRIDARIDSLKSQMPFSPVTGPRAATYFFDELGMAPWKVSETPRLVEEQPDTRKAAKEGATRLKVVDQGDLSAKVARRMADAGVPHADEFAQITELGIFNKMFYRNYADLAGSDQRIRTSFKQAFVRSGRLSVERFQAQALPKKLAAHLDGELLPEPRSLFGVAPGKVRVNLDLSQAELRIASNFCGCKIMSDAVATGSDFHGMTTTAVFGIEPDHPDWKLKRDIAKRLTFGSIFMIGAKRFRETLWDLAGIEWSLNECREAVYAWRNTYPEFGVAYDKWLNFAEKNKYVPLVDGMPSWLTGPRDYPNTAWNRVVQGSLALFATDWIIEIEKMTARHDALVLTVHDSVVLDLPEDTVEELVPRLVTMTEELWWDRFRIPGKVDSGLWAA